MTILDLFQDKNCADKNMHTISQKIPRKKQYPCSVSHQTQFLSYGYIPQRYIVLKDHKTAVVASGIKNNLTIIMQKYIIGKRKHHYCLENHLLGRSWT